MRNFLRKSRYEKSAHFFSQMVFLFALLVVSALATDPTCSPQTFTDNQGNSFTYDLRPFKVSDSSNRSSFLIGQEPGSGWTLYANICGDASIVGCTVSTPVCQFDGGAHYFSLGTPQSWTMMAYYDPVTKTPNPSAGVVVTTNGGDVCGNGVGRQTIWFLKCNPNVVKLPQVVQFQETDPSNQQMTPCKYYSQVIEHVGFCPQQQVVPSPPLSQLHTVSLGVTNPGISVSITTSLPSTLLDIGFSCTPSPSTCQQKTFICSISSAPKFALSGFPLSMVSIGMPTYGIGQYASFPMSGFSPDCNPNTVDVYLTSQQFAQWKAVNGTYSLFQTNSDRTATLLLSVTPKSPAVCNKCQESTKLQLKKKKK